MDKTVQKVLQALWKKSNNGKRQVKPGTVLDYLRVKTGLSQFEIGLAFQALREEELVKCAKWHATPTRPDAMLTVTPREIPIPGWEPRWMALMEMQRLSQEDRAKLLPVGSLLQELSEEHGAKLLAGLIALREDQAKLRGQALYDVSARYLLGASKLLEHIRKPAMEFGINVDSFVKSHKFLAVAGPATPKAVVLIENPHSFEMAINARKDCAFACTYGFGLALGKEERLGQMLVENLTRHLANLKMLVRSGEPPAINKLLKHNNLFFWGDLDLAGMMIFTQLKASFPHIRLSGLYTPMLRRLAETGGHPYVQCVGKGGQKEKKPLKIRDPFVSKILSCCLECGLDQETIGKDEIETYASLELDIP
jgi:hypothetical protein